MEDDLMEHAESEDCPHQEAEGSDDCLYSSR